MVAVNNVVFEKSTLLLNGSRNSSVDRACVRAGLLGVRVPAAAGNFPLHHRVQTGSVAHPASYPMRTRGSFPGGTVAGA
jgi:hypothetical protein